MQSVRQLPRVFRAIALIALFLLVLIPYEVTMQPYEALRTTTSVWKTDLTADPDYPLRASLIVANLAGVMLCLLLSFWASFRVVRERRWSDLLVLLAANMLVVSVGWLRAPYWVNGVYQSVRGGEALGMDPLGILPSVWLGNAWWLTAVAANIAMIFVWPVLFLLSVLVARHDRGKSLAATAMLLAVVALGAISAGFGPWIID